MSLKQIQKKFESTIIKFFKEEGLIKEEKIIFKWNDGNDTQGKMS